MITRFFKYIKRQPRSVRDRYAFSGAVTFTACIAFMWLIQFQPITSQGQTATVSVSAQQDGSGNFSQPFSNLFRIFREQTPSSPAQTGGGLNELQSAIQQSVQVVQDEERETISPELLENESDELTGSTERNEEDPESVVE